jgi:dienelactone hydrolase
MTSSPAFRGLLLSTLLAATPAAGQEYPEVALPSPTGPYAIGTRVEVVVDSTRSERFGADSGGPRVLRIRYWYPASESPRDPVPYMDGPTAATWVERHGFPAGFERRIQTHARKDAAVEMREGRWPLVLFSHGMSWPAAMYQSFHEELASHGYVVAAVDHTGYSDAIVFPDGRVVGFTAWSEPPASDEERRARLAAHMPTWVADLRFALDEIARKSGNDLGFHSSIAATRVGAFGHSYGGGAAARLMEDDARVVAAVNLEGSAYGPDTLPFVVREPLLHVVGGYNRADRFATEFVPHDTPVYEVVIHGTFHSTFSDLIYLHAVKADDAWRERHRYDLEPARALRIANDYLLAFFDRYVKGIDGPRDYLLHLRTAADLETSEARGYPEVELAIDY